MDFLAFHPTVQKPRQVLNIEEQGKGKLQHSTKDRISERSHQDSGLADSLQWTLPSWHIPLPGLKFSSAGAHTSFGSNKYANMARIHFKFVARGSNKHS